MEIKNKLITAENKDALIGNANERLVDIQYNEMRTLKILRT